MADCKMMVSKVLKWEGGWSDNENDSGGPTMRGVTLKTFKHFFGKDKTKEDLKKITNEQWMYIFKKGYWDVMKADSIVNQSLAELCVQCVWGSGGGYVKNIQRAIGANADGIVGAGTLNVLNSAPEMCFRRIWDARKVFFLNICENNKKNAIFLNGWLRRLNDYTYNS